MRILITNDDGIHAEGLGVLAEIAAEVAGPDGEVWTVAPAVEKSGVGHCISYLQPAMIHELGPRRVSVEGTPADCVLAGLHDVMRTNPPDLVLSGVNRGNNSAENVLYSGTIGAAMEAALQGVRAIALSQFFGPANGRADDPFEAARHYGAETVRRLLHSAPWDHEADYRLFYNVNFPPVAGADVKGIAAATQGYRRSVNFGVKPETSPNGRRYLWIHGGPQQDRTAPGSDACLNIDGYVSVTPLRADLTSHSDMQALTEALK